LIELALQYLALSQVLYVSLLQGGLEVWFNGLPRDAKGYGIVADYAV
jgi:hypothetical protein